MGESRALRCGKGEARTQTGIALSSLVPGKRRGLTWTVAGPPKHLAQEGRLVGGGQRELSVTQLLAQAAMQQAQHHVIGGTWPLGGRDALWLCPTHTPLSTQGLLLPSAPGSAPASPALLQPPPPTPSAPSQTHLLSVL